MELKTNTYVEKGKEALLFCSLISIGTEQHREAAILQGRSVQRQRNRAEKRLWKPTSQSLASITQQHLSGTGVSIVSLL